MLNLKTKTMNRTEQLNEIQDTMQSAIDRLTKLLNE